MASVHPVSVVLPTRNRAELLPTVVGCLRSQDYPQDLLEILVMDNGSTDNTRQVVEALAAEAGPALRYIHEPRSGVTFARNRGIEVARHPYVAFCDDDLIIGPGWLKHLMTGFDLAPEVDAVGGRVVLEWECCKPAWIGPELERYIGATTHLGAETRILAAGEHILEGNMALRREACQARAAFMGMEQFGSSRAPSSVLRFLLQLERRGRLIAFVPEASVGHRVRSPVTRRWMLRRGFWQGISDALLAHLDGGRRSLRDVAARSCLLLGHAWRSVIQHIQGDDPGSMVQLTFSAAYVGRLAADLRLVGDWRRLQAVAKAQAPEQFGVSREGSL